MQRLLISLQYYESQRQCLAASHTECEWFEDNYIHRLIHSMSAVSCNYLQRLSTTTFEIDADNIIYNRPSCMCDGWVFVCAHVCSLCVFVCVCACVYVWIYEFVCGERFDNRMGKIRAKCHRWFSHISSVSVWRLSLVKRSHSKTSISTQFIRWRRKAFRGRKGLNHCLKVAVWFHVDGYTYIWI